MPQTSNPSCCARALTSSALTVRSCYSPRMRGRTAVTTFAAAVAAVASIASQGPTDYRAIVQEYRTRPNTAIERILAMPQADVARAVREAQRDSGGFTSSDSAVALVMHGDIAIYLARQQDPRSGSAIDLADNLAVATAHGHDHAWFVHRWYTAFTAALKTDARADGLRDHWKRQDWYRL